MVDRPQCRARCEGAAPVVLRNSGRPETKPCDDASEARIGSFDIHCPTYHQGPTSGWWALGRDSVLNRRLVCDGHGILHLHRLACQLILLAHPLTDAVTFTPPYIMHGPFS